MNKYSATKKLFAPGLVGNSARLSSATPTKPTASSVKGLPERIYNFPVNQEIMKGWKIQTPQDKPQDGMAMAEWGINAKRPKLFFVLYMVFVATGLWFPFFGLETNLRKIHSQ
uniref:Uncharacterized protein n=1 Tax=Ditylenchus dipsaci TaxID=166011 RepID=A0A915DI61_9BILA